MNRTKRYLTIILMTISMFILGSCTKGDSLKLYIQSDVEDYALTMSSVR